jgi:hypothetical protein
MQGNTKILFKVTGFEDRRWMEATCSTAGFHIRGVETSMSATVVLLFELYQSFGVQTLISFHDVIRLWRKSNYFYSTTK